MAVDKKETMSCPAFSAIFALGAGIGVVLRWLIAMPDSVYPEREGRTQHSISARVLSVDILVRIPHKYGDSSSVHFFLCFFDFAFLATESAMATACFWGLPCDISVRIFSLIVFLDVPRFNGILHLPYLVSV